MVLGGLSRSEISFLQLETLPIASACVSLVSATLMRMPRKRCTLMYPLSLWDLSRVSRLRMFKSK